MEKRTRFVVETFDPTGTNILRVSAHDELWKALREAKKLHEEGPEDGPSYASVWGVYTKTTEEALDADSYVRIWSSSEDPPITIPKA